MQDLQNYAWLFATHFIPNSSIFSTTYQTMTEAEHNRPIPKLFSNRPSASAAEVFGLLREPIIFFENNMWNFIESEFHT